MKKIIIYYFSGTGNTWWVAKELTKALQHQNQEVKCISIESLEDRYSFCEISGADHIVLGFPVYGSTAPKLVRDFISRLPASKKNQTASVFGTHALASGDSAYHVGQMLVQKGYRLRHAMHFRMMNNLHIPRFKFTPPRNDHRVDKALMQALPKVTRLSACIIEDTAYVTGNHVFAHILGNLQRKHVDHLIGTASKDFKVNKDACIDCEKCVRICPVQNIKKQDDVYRFCDKCLLCMRCYSQCPKNAILLGEATKDAVKYPRYKGPGKTFNIEVLRKKED